MTSRSRYPSLSCIRSERGLTLTELLVSLAAGSIILLGIFFLVNGLVSTRLNLEKRLSNQESQMLATIEIEKSFANAQAVQLSAVPLEGMSFLGSQVGLIRQFDFTSITMGADQSTLLAVYSQNIGSVTQPIYRARALVFHSPAGNQPGMLYLPSDPGNGMLSPETNPLTSGLVSVTLSDVRTAGKYVRIFQLRMLERSFPSKTDPNQINYCPSADIASGACPPPPPYTERTKLVTILLANNVNTDIPFPGYGSPSGATFGH